MNLFNPNIADKNQNPEGRTRRPSKGVIKPKGSQKEEIERLERKIERTTTE